MGGYVDFFLVRKSRLPKRLNQAWTIADVYFKSFRYDCIYDTLNQTTKVLGVLRKYKLMRAKLVSILHHPPFNLELNKGRADAYIFFNETFRKYAIDVNPDLKDRYFVNEWYPDKCWYESVTCDTPHDETAFFMDNGKTKRDHELVDKICNKNGLLCLTPGDASLNSPQNYMRYYTMDLKDDVGMARRLCGSRVIVIPIKKNAFSLMGPYGITSFLDAMALNMPVICSNNCCFAGDVKTYGLGCTYDTGNEMQLENAMLRLHNDKAFYLACCNNMKSYASRKDMTLYGERLDRILKSVK